MQNTQSEPRNVGGRPREFDPVVVLAAIVDLFWRRSYTEVSVADIEEATGLVRTSLYNLYGSKKAMFSAAVTAYYESVGERMGALLRDGTQGLADIDHFFEMLELQLTSPDTPSGCMVLSSIDELVGIPSLAQIPALYIGGFQANVLRALERSAQLGEIALDSVMRRSEMLMATIIGVNVAHRAGKTVQETRQGIDSIRAEVTSWAQPGTPAP